MEIRLLSLLEGARRAAGTVVIIDVYRAFTTAAVALQRGAARILLVNTPESAFKLRREGRGDLCMGEVSGIKVPGSISAIRRTRFPRPTFVAKR